MEQKHGPWTIVGTEIKYENDWINIREDKVLKPDGSPGIFGIVTMLTGAVVIPMDEEGNVYLEKEFRYAIGQDSIEAPGGARDPKEDPLNTAKRELLEELGIEAGEWVSLGILHPHTSIITSPSHLFFARKLHFTGNTTPEATELITPVKMPFEEAVQLVMESKIVHSPTCMAIMKTKEYLAREKK